MPTTREKFDASLQDKNFSMWLWKQKGSKGVFFSVKQILNLHEAFKAGHSLALHHQRLSP